MTVLSRVLTILPNQNSTPQYVLLFVMAILTIDLIKNIGIGISRSDFAKGNLLGDLIGLLIFLQTISIIFPEAADESVIMTVVLFLSLVLSAVLVGRPHKDDFHGSPF